MTTDAVITRKTPDTDAAHTTMRALSSVVGLGGMRPVAHSHSYLAPAGICWSDPKAEEAQRQISRLNIAKKFAEGRSEERDDVVGITACMSLLGHFSTGPLPVPIASWTAENGASLFLQTDSFYGDLEIDGNTIEYFLKFKEGGDNVEVFNTENIDEGRVPPQLLSHLFKAFVKYNAEVL